ncbi:hypothetical protein AAG906_017466 [Vitis piasezkii]
MKEQFLGYNEPWRTGCQNTKLSLCSLLKPTLEECQQDYYKYLNKLGQCICCCLVAMENKKKNYYSIPPLIESCATDNTKFSKFGTKGKDIGMDFNSWDDKFESVIEDKEDENHDHIDVKANTKEIMIL